MNRTIKAFIICLCISASLALPVSNDNTNNTEPIARRKRQANIAPLAYAGGLGIGYGQYDYNDYYGDYASDYNYDYYDWICDETNCQLCDILTSECCDPRIDINCFLPDSCINNPCLGGGTCITSKTIDQNPDFICVCMPGLTGKYCQLTNDYFIGGNIVGPILQPLAPLPQQIIADGGSFVQQPYAQQPYVQQPYAQQPYAQQPYAQQPYAQQPTAQQQQQVYSEPAFPQQQAVQQQAVVQQQYAPQQTNFAQQPQYAHQ